MKKAFLIAAICQCCLAISAHAARLNITRIGEGTINPNVGVYSYSWGKQVTVTATPAPGWVLDHWEGDLTGTGSSKTFYSLGDKRVTVVFQPQVATPANALVPQPVTVTVEQRAQRTVAFADRTYVLRSGRIVLSGTRAELAELGRLDEAYLGF